MHSEIKEISEIKYLKTGNKQPARNHNSFDKNEKRDRVLTSKVRGGIQRRIERSGRQPLRNETKEKERGRWCLKNEQKE